MDCPPSVPRHFVCRIRHLSALNIHAFSDPQRPPPRLLQLLFELAWIAILVKKPTCRLYRFIASAVGARFACVEDFVERREPHHLSTFNHSTKLSRMPSTRPSFALTKCQLFRYTQQQTSSLIFLALRKRLSARSLLKISIW